MRFVFNPSRLGVRRSARLRFAANLLVLATLPLAAAAEVERDSAATAGFAVGGAEFEFEPGQLVVKLDPEYGAHAAQVPRQRFRESLDSARAGALDDLVARFAVRRMRRVFATFEDAEGHLRTTARTRANEVRRRHRARAARIRAGARVPDLENVYLVEVEPDTDVLEAVAAFAAHPNVVYAEPNYRYRTLQRPLPGVPWVPDDRFVSQDGVRWSEGAWDQAFPDLYGLERIQAIEGWNLFDTNANGAFDAGEPRPGEGVLVAVIDTGVDANHPEIAANLWSNPGEIAGNEIDDDGNGLTDDVAGWDFVNGDRDPADGHGHGTHVAGTIAAVGNNQIGMVGVAPWARIMPVKGLNDDGSGSGTALADAVRYAADMGADVLSNSWGGPPIGLAIKDAFAYAHALGAVSVAAAGNADRNVSSVEPGGLETVVAVAALDSADVRAYFSNYGVGIDVSAPGVEVLSLNANGGVNNLAQNRPEQVVEGDYLVLSGTSMACPHVAGVVAALMSFHPGESRDEIVGRLLGGADAIDDINPEFAGRLGRGRTNLLRSLQAETEPLTRLVAFDVGELSPGAPSDVAVWLKNFWGPVSGVVGTLTSDHPLVVVLESQRVFGDIGIGQTVSNEANPFRVALDPTIAIGEQVTFELHLSGSNGFTETMTFGTSVAQFADISQRSGLPLTGILADHLVLDDTNGDGLADAHWVNFFEYAYHRNDAGARFVDATSEAGFGGMAGVVRALPLLLDFDNDGDRDLFLGGIPSQGSRLYENLGNGTFEDVTAHSGVGEHGAIGAVAIDFNSDGFVDLFGGDAKTFLLKNNGDGTFSDVREAAGMLEFRGHLNKQTVAADFDGDRDTDLLKLNGRIVTIIFHRNNGDGTFTDVAAASGIDAITSSGYGLASGDFDNDGDIDLMITGYGDRDDPNRNRLYRNDGGLNFVDVTSDLIDPALGGISGIWWGNAFFDYDNDGDLDLYLTNEGVTFDLDQVNANALYRNDGAAGFTRVTEQAFPAHVTPSAAGAAIADIDGDGALDIWAPTGGFGFGGQGAVLKNLAGVEHSWLRIFLRGTLSNADAYGTRVTVTTGDLSQIREVTTSPVETQPLHFGLGDARIVDEVFIRWPSGVNQRLTSVAVDQLLEVAEARDICLEGGEPNRGSEALEIDCNAPATITPRDAPISFTAGAIGICDDSPTVIVSAFACTFENPSGRKVDRRDSCVLHADGATIEILNSGGVQNRIFWTVSAEDASGNVLERRCELDVARPGP